MFLENTLSRESSSANELEILIGITPQILKSQERFQCFSEFFHDIAEDENGNRKQKLRFATRVINKALPNYSNKLSELRNFDTS